MKISSIFETEIQPVSFEIFPPKGNLSMESANTVATRLVQLDPDFISVTYSAGGSGNAQATADIAAMIQGTLGVSSVAHLTCQGLTRATLQDRIDCMHALGIENVLALRGDPLAASQPGDFAFAKDLIPLLADEGFCVGAAAYPEGHIDCHSFKDSVEHLKQKQDVGAGFFVTQLFFDNEYFYRFREAADCAGISIPITCGIMPFLSKEQVSRMIFMCGASLPSPIIKLLAKYEHDKASLRLAGIEYACSQLMDLACHGADGLHVYTMNQPDIAAAAVHALRS
jgi:methylenetetrahydrofolate reductase (NADPH)